MIRANMLALLVIATLAASCGVGDPVISSDSRHNGHFRGGSPTEADIAGR